MSDALPIAITTEPLPPNPKQAYGDKKPNLAAVPDTAVILEALSLGDGAIKYGPFNWRGKPVEAMTYIAALRRHIAAWVDGEELAPEEEWTLPTGEKILLGGKPHLAYARACLAIIIDAEANGTLIDNRPPGGKDGAKGAAARLLAKWTKP